MLLPEGETSADSQLPQAENEANLEAGTISREDDNGMRFETNRRSAERSRLAPLARGRFGKLALAALLFTTLAAEVACSKENGDAGKGGEKRMEEQLPEERMFRELIQELIRIPANQYAENPAQNKASQSKALRKGIATDMIRRFLRSYGDTQEAYEKAFKKLDGMIDATPELKWIKDEGVVVSRVTQESQRAAEKSAAEREASIPAEQRAANLLKSFRGMSAQPYVYQKDIADYFNAFPPDKQREAFDALKAAMQKPDLVNTISNAARTELQRALHQRKTK